MSATHEGPVERPPGVADAVRATVGVVCAYAAALLIAAMVAIVGGAANDGIRSAGDTRAQLAVQAVIFAGAAMLLVEGLRLAVRPRERDPRSASDGDDDESAGSQLATVFAVGLAAAIGAVLVGPLVAALLPNLHDDVVPVNELGLGKGLGADIGTVIVVAGIIPFGEELLFRGVLVGAWARAGRPVLAVAVSSVLFGLAHLTVGSRTVVVTLLLGALFAAAMLLARSLGAAVLAHGVVNALALLDGGLVDPVPIAVLVLTVLVATAAATRISRSVWLPAPVGTLDG
ncbi:MAG: CPBP family intramembrane metalloprotease [Patulibacter minatonensis]